MGNTMTTSAQVASIKGSDDKTHDVMNQVSPLTGYNLFLTDKTLVEAVRREGAGWAESHIAELGHLLGTEEVQRWGFDSNENKPVLHTHDAAGNRRDEVVFHPAWHNLMRTSVEHRLHSLPWEGGELHHGDTEARRTTELGPQGKKGIDDSSAQTGLTGKSRPGAHVARAALMMITVQNEAGHTCPISMTFSGMAALQAEPELAAEWGPKLMSPTYDPRFLPVTEKSGALLGMGMTEKQGGSDVRANTTQAERIGNHSRDFLITGHKWFCSAPMCDAFLILAQAPKGLTCFLLPRWNPAGAQNNFYIQRLKDKMGNRSNASSEVEFARAWARQVGEEGRGVNTIIEMVNHTRLDCAIASAGLMRQALVQALHHCRHRKAFGKLLIDQPLMRHVLADLTVESEAATLMVARLARAFDEKSFDERASIQKTAADHSISGNSDASRSHARAFSRIATAICKYWLCKRSPVHVGEALECLGGNGYVEESIMPRLYREAPLYGIWEGSGNVICLDVLRALSKDPATAEALIAEFKTAAGADSRLDKYLTAVQSDLQAALAGSSSKGAATANAEHESRARWLTERLALALQATLVVRHGRKEVAEAFVASRIAGDHGHNFGTLPADANIDAIMEGL